MDKQKLIKLLFRYLKNKHAYLQYLDNINKVIHYEDGVEFSTESFHSFKDLLARLDRHLVLGQIITESFTWSTTQQDHTYWALKHADFEYLWDVYVEKIRKHGTR